MSVVDLIASSQGRRDDAPNKALAKMLVANQDADGIGELVGNLSNPDKAVQSDCIKVLYEVGYLAPDLIAPFWDIFLDLLSSKNNRLVWGSMIALDAISAVKTDELFASHEVITKTVKTGSVITQDAGIRALSQIAGAREDYREEILPFLLGFLQTCRPKDLPRHAEGMLPAIDSQHAALFLALLSRRRSDLTDHQAARLQKVMNNVRKPNPEG